LKEHNKENRLITAVILAAGCGSRMGAAEPKHRLTVAGDTVLRHTIKAFEACGAIDSVVVVVREDEIQTLKRELSDFNKIHAIVSGGETRAESARRGFSAIPVNSHLVAIHDGARCLVTPEIIEEVVLSAMEFGAATAGVRVYDTVKSTVGEEIVSTIKREELFLAHTPQVFECGLYRKALEASNGSHEATDDNFLLEAIGIRVKAVDTGKTNVKITTPDDLSFAEYVLTKRSLL